MPSKKKKYNARFPPARIKKIMQTDDEVGKVAAAVPVIISRALELFVEALITKANEITQARSAKTLTTLHLKQCILAETKFDFLKDLVASVPDVQVEDETSNSSVNALSSGDGPKVSNTKTVVQRVKRSKDSKSSTENNAGPSNSDEDSAGEEEDDEDEEDGEDEDDDENNGDEKSNVRHLAQGATLKQSNMDSSINRFNFMAATNSDDEDYDS